MKSHNYVFCLLLLLQVCSSIASESRWFWPEETQPPLLLPSLSIRVPRRTTFRPSQPLSRIPIINSVDKNGIHFEKSLRNRSIRKELNGRKFFVEHDISRLPLSDGNDIFKTNFDTNAQSSVLSEISKETEGSFNIPGKASKEELAKNFFSNVNIIRDKDEKERIRREQILEAKRALDIPDISLLPLSSSHENVQFPPFPKFPPRGRSIETQTETSQSLFISPSRIKSLFNTTKKPIPGGRIFGRTVSGESISGGIVSEGTLPPKEQSSIFGQNAAASTGLNKQIHHRFSPFVNSITSVPIHITTASNELIIEPAKLITKATTRFQNPTKSTTTPKVSITKRPSTTASNTFIRLIQEMKKNQNKSNEIINLPTVEKDENNEEIIFIIENDPEENINIKPRESSLDMVLNLGKKKISPSIQNSLNIQKLISTKQSRRTPKSIHQNLNVNSIHTLRPSSKPFSGPNEINKLNTSPTPQKFTPSTSINSQHSFRPSTFFPSFIPPKSTFRTTIHPGKLITKSRNIFLPSKQPFLDKNIAPFTPYLWLWPGGKRIFHSSKTSIPSVHAL